MDKRIFISFVMLFLLSSLSADLVAQVTEQEIDQFMHRYLNDDGGGNDRHCHGGYCYYSNWHENREDRTRSFGIKVKIEVNIARSIVRSVLRQHEDLFSYLKEIRTDVQFLPYLQKYKDLKIKFTSRPLSTNMKVILLGDEWIIPYMLYNGRGVGQCDYLEGMVLINVNIWNNCIKHDPLFSEFLIFHELAHCDLKRLHNDNDDNEFSFMNQSLMASFINQALKGPINACQLMDSLDVFNRINRVENLTLFERSYIEENLERTYAELFSKDNSYDYDDSHYIEVEDLSGFTEFVNNDILTIKQRLQRLVQSQQQTR